MVILLDGRELQGRRYISMPLEHGVKWSGLKAAIDSGLFNDWKATNLQEKLRLVFLCDKYNFEEFRKQSYLNSEGKTYKRQADIEHVEQHFEQYAWELDVDEQLKQHQASLKRVVKSKQTDFGAFGMGDELKPVTTISKGKGKGKGKGKEVSGPSAGALMLPSSSISSSVIRRKRPADQAGLDNLEGD